jgi:hypothetical protein
LTGILPLNVGFPQPFPRKQKKNPRNFSFRFKSIKGRVRHVGALYVFSFRLHLLGGADLQSDKLFERRKTLRYHRFTFASTNSAHAKYEANVTALKEAW